MEKKQVSLEDCLTLLKEGKYKSLIDQFAVTEDFKTMHKLMKSKEVESIDVGVIVFYIISSHDETENEKMKDMYVKVLDAVTASSKMASHTAEQVCNFAIENEYSKSLWNIAKSKCLTPKIAKKICEYCKATNTYNMTVAMEFLAENDKTPDDILFYIVEEDCSESVRKIANENLAIRYKLLKEKLNQSEYGRTFLNN